MLVDVKQERGKDNKELLEWGEIVNSVAPFQYKWIIFFWKILPKEINLTRDETSWSDEFWRQQNFQNI